MIQVVPAGFHRAYNFQNSRLVAALSNGYGPAQLAVAEWLSLIADLSSSTAALAVVRLPTLPLSISSRELCNACPMSASISATMRSISLPASQRNLAVALTGCARSFKDANPRPTPYSILARVRMSLSSVVGSIPLPSARMANRPSHEGFNTALLCANRLRAASVNAEATAGGLAERRPLTAARNLDNPGCQNIIHIGTPIATYSSVLALAINVSTIRFLGWEIRG